MILSVTLSKPISNIENFLDKPYEKIKINLKNSDGKISYFAQMFTKTQVFHKHFSEEELLDFLTKTEGKIFKNCVKKTDSEEITILANKKGKITTLKKSIKNDDKIFSNKKEKLYFARRKTNSIFSFSRNYDCRWKGYKFKI